MKLLNCPRQFPDESLTAFILRLANGNYASGRALNAMIVHSGRAHDEYVTLCASHGAGSAGSGIAEQSRMQPHWRIPYRPYTSCNRLCRRCLHSDSVPYLRKLWDDPLELVCRVHGDRLLHHCSHCGKAISGSRRWLLSCECGAAFQSAEPRGVPHWMDQAMRAYFLGRYNETVSRATHDYRVALWGSIDALGSATRRLFPTSYPPYRTRSKMPSSSDPWWHLDRIMALEPWFTRWPHGGRECFEQLSQVVEIESWKRQARHDVFPGLALILDPFEWHRLETVAAPPFTKHVNSAEFMSAREFSARCGVDIAACDWWTSSGRVPVLSPSGSAYEDIVIERSSGTRLAALCLETDSIKTAAEATGFSQNTIEGLIAVRLISSLPMCARGLTFRVWMRQIAGIVRRCASHARQGRISCATHISLADAIAIALRYRTHDSLFFQILRGDLRVWTATQSVGLASSVWLESAPFNAWKIWHRDDAFRKRRVRVDGELTLIPNYRPWKPPTVITQAPPVTAVTVREPQ